MRRTISAMVTALLLIGMLTAVPAAMAQQTDTATETIEQTETETNETETETTETETNETDENDTVSPGAQLSGIVGVGEAELSGEVESRAFGIRVAQAASNESKAGVLKDQLNRTGQRLEEIEAQRAELKNASENGSISQGEYRARLAKLHAESQTIKNIANQTNKTAGDLPEKTLEANDVNTTAIRTLSDRAKNLSGPEVAEIARGIAGNDVGRSAGPLDRAGGPGGEKRPGADRGPEQTDRGPGADRGKQNNGGNTTQGGAEQRGGSTQAGGSGDRTDTSGNQTTSGGANSERTNGGSDSGGSGSGVSSSGGSSGGYSGSGSSGGSGNGGSAGGQ
jgi:hypothetical protein